MVGDGYCQDEANKIQCAFDGGDCCYSNSCVNMDFCTDCLCLNKNENISNPLIGDGYCQDGTNNADCDYDGGDCCGTCIITSYCTNCSCIEDVSDSEVLKQGIGDGLCNDETNNAACYFDNGDCCLTNLITDRCTNCTCYSQETCEAGILPLDLSISTGDIIILPPSVGDGYCTDVTNIQQCNFDGGDCCLLKVNTDYCSNCSCSNSGVITSPGFPETYDTNLNLTWLIKVPLGQLIEISFDSFDLEIKDEKICE